MKNSEKLGFVLPDYSDRVNIESINTNFRKIDELFGDKNGIATLDDSGKIPTKQLPDIDNNKNSYDTFAAFVTGGLFY